VEEGSARQVPENYQKRGRKRKNRGKSRQGGERRGRKGKGGEKREEGKRPYAQGSST